MRNIVNGLVLRGETVLLVRRSPHRRAYAGLWSFPGGHVEADESLEAALVRELGEEIGIQARDFALMESFADPNAATGDPITYHMFRVTAWDGGAPVLLGDEHTELAWPSLAEAAAMPGLALAHYRTLLERLDDDRQRHDRRDNRPGDRSARGGAAMAAAFAVRPFSLDEQALKELAAEARAEDFDFVDRLIAEWRSGANRFAGDGEKLLAMFDGETVIAVGGLNRDPYTTNARVGRMRHVYVRAAYRRRGAAGVLLEALLNGAGADFDRVRLRSTGSAADRFYESRGFRRTDEAAATHTLDTTRESRDGGA